MRRFILGFCLFSMFFLSSGDAFGQKMIDRNQINERISALRSRLKQYQTEFQKSPEVVEVKLEKISEELENRNDVAVTVLFHDPESGEPVYDLKEEMVEDEENSSSGNVEETKDESTKRLEELQRRQDLFKSLREKVQLATRSSLKNAQNINNLVAQIR